MLLCYRELFRKSQDFKNRWLYETLVILKESEGEVIQRKIRIWNEEGKRRNDKIYKTYKKVTKGRKTQRRKRKGRTGKYGKERKKAKACVQLNDSLQCARHCHPLVWTHSPLSLPCLHFRLLRSPSPYHSQALPDQ